MSVSRKKMYISKYLTELILQILPDIFSSKITYDICGSPRDGGEECYLLEYDDVESGSSLLMFEENVCEVAPNLMASYTIK
jgi:hypothetical protein